MSGLGVGFGSSKGESPLQHLPVESMVEAAEVFTEAYYHVLENLDSTQQGSVQKFVAGLVLTEKPYLMVTPEGVQRAVATVFENESNRDFVFTLLYTFGSRWALSLDRFEGLCANLAVGLSPISQHAECLVPKAVADRLVSSSEIYRLLVANQWLVVLLLLQLFLKVSLQKASPTPQKP